MGTSVSSHASAGVQPRVSRSSIGNAASTRPPTRQSGAEHDGPRERRVPQHLRLAAEARRRDGDRLAEAEHERGDHAGAEPVGGGAARAHGVGRNHGRHAARARRRVGEAGGRARGLGVVHLPAVHAAPLRRVVGGPRPPEPGAAERERLGRPEAERGRHDRRARADQVLQQHELRELADPLAGDRHRREHGGEDLDRRGRARSARTPRRGAEIASAVK